MRAMSRTNMLAYSLGESRSSRQNVGFRSHGLLQIIQGTLRRLRSASVGAEHVPLAHSILVRKVVWKKLEKFSGYPADHTVFSGDQRDPAHDPLIFQGDF